MAGEEHEPALAAVAEARQRIREELLVKLGRSQVLARAAVFEHELAVVLDAGGACLFRRRIRIDELKADVGLVFLVAGDEFTDRAPLLAALAGVRGNAERRGQALGGGLAGLGQRVAAVGGEIELQRKFAAQPLQQAGGDQKQQHEARIDRTQLPLLSRRMVHALKPRYECGMRNAAAPAHPCARGTCASCTSECGRMGKTAIHSRFRIPHSEFRIHVYPPRRSASRRRMLSTRKVAMSRAK